MTMIGKDFPVRANAFCLNSEKRASNAPMSPAATPCFDIFSPAQGDSEVISQVERLSSNETKSAKIAADGARRFGLMSYNMHGRLQSVWLQPHSARAPVAFHPPWDVACIDAPCAGTGRS